MVDLHPLVIPVGFGEARFVFSLVGDARPLNVTVGFEAVAGDTLADGQTALNDMEGDFWADVLSADPSQWAPDYTYLGATATFNGSDSGKVEIVAPRAETGTGTNASLPQNCALLVQKRTGLGGRKGRGRFFMPPVRLDEGSVAPNGQIDSAAVTVEQGLWDTWMGHADGSGGQYRIVILHHDNPVVGPVPAPTNILSLVVENLIGTQRRRLRR